MVADDYSGEDRRTGEERRAGFCTLHKIKCEQIKGHGEKIDELTKSKLSVNIFRMMLGVLLLVAAGYWHNIEKESTEYQKAITEQLATHNSILKKMSFDVRETKLNVITLMKAGDLEYQTIPRYYGD